MIEFKPESRWRSAGAPRLVIPPEIQEWMDRSYHSGNVCELPMDEDSPDAADFVKLLRHYAQRQGKSCFVQFFQQNGSSHLRFKMRDKRAYTKPVNLTREKR